MAKQEKRPKSIAVIEDDAAVRRGVAKVLEELQPDRLDLYESGEAGWAACQETIYDLVVMDWKLPDLSGLALVNRFRTHPNYLYTPMIVMSGFLNRKDFTLLEEFAFTALIEKPFAPTFLQRKVRELVREQEWFAQQKALVVDAGLALENNTHQALQAIRGLIETAPKPVPIALAAARQFVANKNFSDAEALLRDLLKAVPDCLLAMNELGKVLLYMQRFSEAGFVLRRALSLSPDNIERLCLLGSASLNMLNPEAAEGYFESAKAIDPRSSDAAAGGILAKNVDHFLCRSNVTSLPASFAGLLNAIGISMVRSGRFQEGIEHYQSAMKYVSHEMSKAKLAFNLGLGYVRWHKPGEALPWFQRSMEFSEGAFEKATSFVRRLSLQLADPAGPKYSRLESLAATDLEPVGLGDGSPVPSSLDFAFGADLTTEDFALPKIDSTVMEGAEPRVDAMDDGEDETLAKTRDRAAAFEDIFPDCTRFVQLLRKAGENVDTSLERILSFVKEYGVENVRDAIRDQIRKESCSIHGIKKRLKGKSSAGRRKVA